MTHPDYIKKRDEILDRFAEYEEHSEYHYDCDVSDGHVEFDSTKAAHAIDALVLEVIGVSLVHAGSYPLSEDVRFAVNYTNQHKNEQRHIVKGEQS